MLYWCFGCVWNRMNTAMLIHLNRNLFKWRSVSYRQIITADSVLQYKLSHGNYLGENNKIEMTQQYNTSKHCEICTIFQCWRIKICVLFVLLSIYNGKLTNSLTIFIVIVTSNWWISKLSKDRQSKTVLHKGTSKNVRS